MRMENNGLKLWIPYDSSQRINTDWLWANFPPEERFATMIFESENVLHPDVIRSMYRVHKEIEKNGKNMEVCVFELSSTCHFNITFFSDCAWPYLEGYVHESTQCQASRYLKGVL